MVATGIAGCGSKKSASVEVVEDAAKADVPVQEIDAAAKNLSQPSREEAAKVLNAFATALLDSPTEAIQESLRIPEGLSEKQLAFFYKELRMKHVSRAGVEAVLSADFGPLAERLGEKAPEVAEQLGIPLADAWAFGGVERAAVLYWDGERFWVSGVFRLR